VHEGEVNEPVYDFSANFLVWLDGEKEVKRSVFPYLQVRLAFLLGFGLQVDKFDKNTESGYLNIEAGSISPEPASGQALRLSKNQLRFLQYSAASRKVSVLEKELEKNELRNLIDHLDRYFRYHMEGLKPRRSDAIFEQILKD
jgi:DNA repair protein RecO (recombination protein O)